MTEVHMILWSGLRNYILQNKIPFQVVDGLYILAGVVLIFRRDLHNKLL